MPVLSVIVPVYNAEKYIGRCIDSILKQTFSDFELLIINDGSTDHSYDICKNYSQQDERIRLFSQLNAGVSAARNIGLQNAAGQFISMIDADDFIEPDMYERMLQIIEEKNADVAICGMNYYDESLKYLYSRMAMDKEYSTEELLEELWKRPNQLGGSCANKIFRKSAIGNSLFDTSLRYCEDIMYLVTVFPDCKYGIQMNASFYDVFLNQSSSTRKNEYEASYQIILASEKIFNKARNQSFLIRSAVSKYIDDCIRYANIMKKNKQDHHDYMAKMLIIKYKLMKALMYSFRTKALPRSEMNGYIYEFIKL